MDKIAINCTDFSDSAKQYVQEACFKMGYKWSTPGYRHLRSCAYAIINGSLASITKCRKTTIEEELPNHNFLTFNELMELADCQWRMMDNDDVGIKVDKNIPWSDNEEFTIHLEAVSYDNQPKTDRSKPRNKYDREILPGVFIDVYDVLSAFKTDSPAVDHAAKKLLAPGKRGHKDRVTDLKEAIASIESEIAKINEWSE